MTSLTSLYASPTPARIVASWNALSTRWNPFATIVGAWAALTIPLVFFRGYNSDEGLTVSIARTAIEHGGWLDQHMFSLRWVDSPRLLAWIIAAISVPFGAVTQITARLPAVLFLLFGCLLIYVLLRKVAASVPAALFGVALFLACPLLIRYGVTITADLPLAVLLFFAFFLWWGGNEQGSVSFGRWLAMGFVLALAGLMKGPQLIAYFALGIGLYVLATRSWRQIPGLVMAGLICAIPLAAWYAAIYVPGDETLWAGFMRVRPSAQFSGPLTASFRTFTETLPAALAAAAFLIAQALRGKGFVRPGFVGALACFAFVAPLFILFWPGGSTPRYYMPMVLPLCVFGGLGYDLLGARRPGIVAPILVLTACCLIYALAISAASPFLPTRYRQEQMQATQMTALVQAAPAPIYRTGDTALNILPYVPGRILDAAPDDFATIAGPAWLVVPADRAEVLLARRPEKLHAVMPLGEKRQWRLLRLDK
jgi:4-amino-4-deoxy-L-arabinose transferase-like glycosyltransferase